MKRFTVYPSSYVRASSDAGDGVIWTSDDGAWSIEGVELDNGKTAYTILKDGKKQYTTGDLAEAKRVANTYSKG